MERKVGVVLLNLGGPDSLEAVEPFLYNLFRDPDIIDFPGSFLFRRGLAKLISKLRHPRIQEQYKQIGGRSPLKEFTLRQAKLLEESLQDVGPIKVYTAMRYWTPFTQDAIDEIVKDGVTDVILLPLYPQYSKATTESSEKEWNRVMRSVPENKRPKVTLIEEYCEFPPYIDAIAERITEGMSRFPESVRDSVHILYSAHGTPMKLVEQGDPYSHHIKKTVDALIAELSLPNDSSLCYQSKVGPLKWLTPSTPDTINELAVKGVENMLVVPVAFTSDHLETLFEVGIEFKHMATAAGVRQFEVTTGLNDSPTFIGALDQLVRREIKPAE